MKVVERLLRDYIAQGRSFLSGNTRYDATLHRVYLHDNLIARKNDQGNWEFTMAGWPTSTTRSRINAIAGDWIVRQQQGRQLHRDGRELSTTEWFS